MHRGLIEMRFKQLAKVGALILFRWKNGNFVTDKTNKFRL